MVVEVNKTVHFKFDLNLKKLSLLNVAASLWEKPDVKQEILEYGLDVIETKCNKYGKENNWRKVVDYVLNQAENLQIPAELLHEVKITVILTGGKYFAWVNHVIKDELFDLKMTPQVMWTPYGSIHEIEIFKEILIKNPNYLTDSGNVISPFSISKLLLFVISASFGNFDAVCEIMEKIREKNEEHLGYDELFLFCARAGYLDGADYFYEKLENKESIYETALDFIFTDENDIIDLINDDYELEQRPELLLYFLKKKSEDERREFIINFFPRIYGFFFKSWPYVPISMELLKYWDCLSPEIQSEIFKITVDIIDTDLPRKGWWYAYYSVYQPALENMLLITPIEIKLDFLLSDNSPIFGFFAGSNYSAIRTILNDAELKKFRSEILDISRDLALYITWEDGNFRNIEKYMSTFKFSEEEKRSLLKFCKDLNILNQILCRGNFNNAEQFITWHLYLKGEDMTKDRIQEFIDPSIFIENDKFCLLEMYLKWVSGGDSEELEKLKKKIFTRDFIILNFFLHWVNVSISEKKKYKCYEYLNYFFKTQEELSNLKKIVEADDFFLTLVGPMNHLHLTLFSTMVVRDLDEIYTEIFLVSPEKVAEIKKKIKNNLDDWFDLFREKLTFLDGIIKWVCDDEEERLGIIKKFIGSSEGLLLCFNILKTGLDDSQRAANTVILDWIKGEENITEIRDRIENLKGSEGVNDDDVDRVVEELGQILFALQNFV